MNATLVEVLPPDDSQADHAELEAIDSMMGVLPDHLLVVHGSRAGKQTAVEFRVRAAAALRALSELASVVETLQPGRVRSDLVQPLRKWRATRARIAHRMRAARGGA